MDIDEQPHVDGGAVAQPAARTFSQDEVNSIAAAARRAGEEKAARLAAEFEAFKAKMSERDARPAPVAEQRPQPAPEAKPQIPATIHDVEFMTSLAFQAGRLGLDDKVRGKIWALYQVEKPTNSSEWLAETISLFAPTARAEVTAEAPVSQQNQSPPSVPSPIAPSAPSVAVPLERDVDILTMSPGQVHDMIRRKGGDPSRPYDPKNRAGRRAIRQEFEAAMATRRVRLGSSR